jgi:chromosome segregation ATPase
MKTVVKIDALAASIATVIALGADEVQMNQNAFFMIHNPWTVVMGEADEMRKQADVMDKIKDVIVGIYLRKTRISRAELSDLMDNETWLTAEEAKRMNFIDVISGGLAIAACATTGFINNFNNIPKGLKMAEELENVSNELEVNEVETTEVEETVTNETEEVENVEESTEETNEVEEAQEETILNKVKTYLSSLISEKQEEKNELSDRYGEVTNELKEANNLIEDLKAESVEKDDVLNKSLDAIKNLESKNEKLEKEVEELKAKLSEPVGEELVATPQNEVKKDPKSFKNVLAEIKKQK